VDPELTVLRPDLKQVDQNPITAVLKVESHPGPALQELAPDATSPSLRGIQIGLMCLLIILLYAPIMRELAKMWWGHDRLDGFLIPFITLYIVWVRRNELLRLPVRPVASLGTPIILLAGLSLVAGQYGGVALLGAASLIPMLVGLILLLFGAAHLKRLVLPIGYLFFMLPFLDDIVAPLHWPFQLLTAKQGAAIFQFLGFPPLVEGQLIVLPTITLEVAKVCSGVNYLLPILTIGLPLAYLSLRTWWSGLTLVLGALAIGIISNWVRVLLIGMWAYYGGQVLHGPFHFLQGKFVAWVGYTFLFLGAWALSRAENRISMRRAPATSEKPGNTLSPATAQAPRCMAGADSTLDGTGAMDVPRPFLSMHSRCPASQRFWNCPRWIALGCLAGFAVVLFLHANNAVGLSEDLTTFPSTIEEWTETSQDILAAPFKLQGVDAELARVYRNQQGETAWLYVGYFTTQVQGRSAASYLTAPLHEGARKVAIVMDPDRQIAVNERLSSRDRGAQRQLFWYVADGRIIANRYQAKLVTILSGIVRGRTNGAFVLITMDPALTPEGSADPEAETLVRNVVRLLRKHLP
jgi:EpsI family protein